MDIEALCKQEIPVTVWIKNEKIEGTIVRVGIMPGHMARIGFTIKTDIGKIVLINEPCSIHTEFEVDLTSQ